MDLLPRNGSRGTDRARRTSLVGVSALCVACGGALVGCNADSFFDQSVVGRWEQTPTVVPILERIDLIERDSGEFVETTDIIAEDLIPEVEDYAIGSGDQLFIEIFDFIEPNVPSQFQRIVGPQGTIDMPQLGRINTLGLTAEELREQLRAEIRNAGIIEDALVSVQVTSQRRSTYSVFGFINGVGRYFIPEPDYRILEALTEAGGVPSQVEYVFVIRQVPLTDEAEHGAGVTPADKPFMPGGQPAGNGDPDRGTNLLDLIDDLTEEPEDGGAPGSMGAFGSVSGTNERRVMQDTSEPQGSGDLPPIDLVDEPGSDAPPIPIEPRDLAGAGAETPQSRWMFLNGEWVKVTRERRADGGLPEGADPLGGGLLAEDLFTQRVIRVPMDPLQQGAAQYNIVIRPGDIIRIPAPEQGVVYVGGRGITRPGTYNMPAAGRLTLTKAIIAAGGLSPIGVPQRVDLTRMVGEDRQATIQLNLAAIYEGTQPDVFLKPDDVVNCGTNFWAAPLAVIRGGFRTSYGFGFLLDRNFGNDVFGAPPTNVR